MRPLSRRPTVRVLSVILAALPAFALRAADPPRLADCPELKQFAAVWKDAMQPLGVPGLAVVVVKGDRVIALDAFGLADPRTSRPVTPDTMFYIASATKTYTAADIVALVDAGKLDLDAPVKKYLPRFDLADAGATERLTLRDLLCHRPGLQSGGIPFNDAFTGQITEDRYFRLLKQVRPAESPRYSNVHFTLLGRVIEAVSGRSWKDDLEERLFKPAGMMRTTAYASRMYADGDCAWPCEEQADGGFALAPLIKTDRVMHAAGGMGTTARDLGCWLRLNLNRGKIDGRSILAVRSVAEMHRKQSAAERDRPPVRLTGFGLAWMVGRYREKYAISQHGGGYTGTSALIAMLPKEQIGIGILTNAGSGPVLQYHQALLADTFDRLLGLPGENLVADSAGKAAEFRRANKPTPPAAGADSAWPRTLESYAGRYEHADFGPLEIKVEGAALAATMGELRCVLLPAGGDRLLAPLMPDERPLAGRFAFGGEGERPLSVSMRFPGEEITLQRLP